MREKLLSKPRPSPTEAVAAEVVGMLRQRVEELVAENTVLRGASTEPEPTGVKYDAGKPPVDLVPEEYVLAAARAFAYGAAKYSRHNWRGGMKLSRLYSSLQRHLLAWNDGEDIDPESNLSHLDHAAASLAMLLAMAKMRPDLDDRWMTEP
jgi:hypothetical protein